MKLKLVKIVEESPDVKSFFWKTDEKIKWQPGQYFYYTLPKLNYDDPRGATRHFTISSSPTEGDLLRLTTKFITQSSPVPLSGFKKTLLELKIEDQIDGRGPQGTFTPKYGVFIAGGIGITPFRSMIKYNFDRELELPYLIYSNSDDNFVFGNELNEMLDDRLILHNSSKSGHIDAIKINEFIINFKLKINNFYFSTVGPPKFVDSIEKALEQLGINSNKINSEKFTGY